MRSLSYIIVTLLLGYVTAQEKLAKHFSLFSVVTFGNEECTASSTVAGGDGYNVVGTCYSSTECSDKSGMASGNCASGFGVCCVFLNTGAVASTITENRTRLRNAEYPSIATATTAQSIAYTINKMNADICQIRLDFDNFVIAGPSVTTENIPLSSGTVCQDTLTLTTTDVATWSSMPTGKLCGALIGEHLYVELSPTSSDALTATLATAVSGTLTPAIAQRVWDVKISQIECHATYRAPAGCQRYMMETSGTIISMNFYKVTGSTLAANAQNSGIDISTSNIKTCIRRAKHMCCVQYNVCTTYQGIALADWSLGTGGTANMGSRGVFNEGWSFDINTDPFLIDVSQVNVGLVDSQCSGDYVEIPSSMSRSCGSLFGSHYNGVNTRYCGSKLGANWQRLSAQAKSSAVCDCSEPFSVSIHLDDLNDSVANNGAGDSMDLVAGTTNPRGTCLDYRQTPCYH